MFVQTLLATHRWWENSSPSFFHPIKLLFLVAPRAHSPPGGQQPQLCVRRAPPAALPPGPAAALWLFLVNTSLQFIDSLLEKQHYIISFSLKNTFFFFFFFVKLTDSINKNNNKMQSLFNSSAQRVFYPVRTQLRAIRVLMQNSPPRHDLRSLAWRSEDAFQTIAAHSVIFFSFFFFSLI